MPISKISTYQKELRLPGGFRLPAQMTAIELPNRDIALISPIQIDDTVAASLRALGEIRYLLAPNLLHHLYLRDAKERYPEAMVLAPPRLAEKRPDVKIDATYDAGLPAPLAEVLAMTLVEGAPAMGEYVFFHRPSKTLVVTDLVFHVREPKGFMANTLLFLVGCHSKLAQSRVWRLQVKDRALAAASAQKILAYEPENLIMSHGDVIEGNAHTLLREALRPML